MIGYLSGTPSIIGNTLLIITQGVGYEVHVGSHTLSKVMTLPNVELFIYTHVREDELSLFGFLSGAEKGMFSLLLEVSGVGPKTALAIAEQSPQAISQAVQQADTAFFTQFPRVGKKLAQKIIIDLRSKLGSMRDLDLGPVSQQATDLSEALIGLGYSERDVSEVLRQIEIEAISLEDALKQAMKLLSKK